MILKLLSLCVVFVIAGGAFFFREAIFSNPPKKQFSERVAIGERVYTLEIAATKEEQSRGLGERDSLCDTCAMLFIFPDSSRYAFWMKGMRFPLDIVWLLGDKVVHVEREISAESKDIYRPKEEANQVLEFNAGAAAALQSGDTVRFLPISGS